MTRILDRDGYFYINVFDHWSGDMYQRKICAFETERGAMTSDWQAAFREGGGLAIAALAWVASSNLSGAFTAEQYLEAAKKGFQHLLKYNEKSSRRFQVAVDRVVATQFNTVSDGNSR